MWSVYLFDFFFSSRRRHTRYIGDWSSDVCSSDLDPKVDLGGADGNANRSDPELEKREGDRHIDHRAIGRVVPDLRRDLVRSEERRVGKEWRYRWAAEA